MASNSNSRDQGQGRQVAYSYSPMKQHSNDELPLPQRIHGVQSKAQPEFVPCAMQSRDESNLDSNSGPSSSIIQRHQRNVTLATDRVSSRAVQNKPDSRHPFAKGVDKAAPHFRKESYKGPAFGSREAFNKPQTAAVISQDSQMGSRQAVGLHNPIYHTKR